MTEPVEDIVALCRLFGLWERDRVCCGTVTVPQCIVLQALLSGPSEVAPLAASVGNSPSAMTRLVDGLATKGWVDRTRDTQDRRRVHVSLTTSGRSEAERLRRLTKSSVDAVMKVIPAHKQAQVRESLALVRRAMEVARAQVDGCAVPGSAEGPPR